AQLCTVALRCVTSAVGVIHVTGYVGRKVNVSCSYDRGYESYEKYLCKDGCGSSDVLITTSGPVKNKYSIHDNKTARIFTTAISDLSQNDSGSYLCGVQSNSDLDVFTATTMTWRTENLHMHTFTVFYFGFWFSGSALYVVYTVPPVLLLTCVLVIVYKYRRSRVKGTFYIHIHTH
uniref:Immunoglobulin V-set domain-containing protein n=1 Tax=Amphilophus citrinellus TaxID=61819 RepID=A0A3Q0SQT0_AMPCI